MTDGLDERPPDDRPDGGGGEVGDDGTDPGEGRADRGEDRADPDDDGPDQDDDGVGPDGGAGPDGDGEEHDPSLAGVFGARPEDEPPRKELVPESPSLENALFLLLGTLLGGFVVYRAVTVFTV